MSPSHLFTPNTALVTLTAGILLIYVELNRPGRIIPGAIGLLITLLAVPSLDHNPSPGVPILQVFFIATVILGLRRKLHPAVYVIAIIALIAGFHAISGISWLNAILCGLILGVASSLLARIAHRARLNKGLD